MGIGLSLIGVQPPFLLGVLAGLFGFARWSVRWVALGSALLLAVAEGRWREAAATVNEHDRGRRRRDEPIAGGARAAVDP